MITITVNNFLSLIRRSVITVLITFGLGGCTPIALPQLSIPLPQLYRTQQPNTVMMPALPQQTQAQQARGQSTVPEAGALTAAPPAAAARTAVPVTMVAQAQPQSTQMRPQTLTRISPAQTQSQTTQFTVPPVLNPVQQRQVRRSVKAGQNSYDYRAPASATRAPARNYRNQQPMWEERATDTRPQRKKPTVVRRPSASVRKPPAPSVAETKPANQSTQRQIQQAKTTEPEVLDLSASLPPSASADKSTPKAPPAVPRSYNSSPAVSVLIKQVNNQLTVGKTAQAAATLERALRIEPENPLLWLRLAEVNAQQGKQGQAASMARKAINLAPEDAGLQARGQRLIK